MIGYTLLTQPYVVSFAISDLWFDLIRALASNQLKLNINIRLDVYV